MYTRDDKLSRADARAEPESKTEISEVICVLIVKAVIFSLDVL